MTLAVLLPVAVALHLFLEDRLDLFGDVNGIGAFVSAVGTLYSVLAGFVVVTVWGQFTDTDRAVKREAREIRELWRYVGYISDEAGIARARQAVERYRDNVLKKEWPAMLSRETPWPGEGEFFEMVDAVNEMTVSTRKDAPAWAEAVRTLGELGDARGDRWLLVNLRMPRVLRLLLYVGTTGLVGGIILLGFQNAAIGAMAVSFSVITSVLVLEVIDDMDNPFNGSWRVTSAPFERIRFSLDQHRQAIGTHPKA